MAVKLRLARTGRHGYASYRVVAADSRYPRDGRFLEIVGTYNPNTNPATVTLNNEVALKWLNNGAQPTDTVKKLFKDAGIMKAFHESKKAATTKGE
jgi:small subunit ribosomal protein S16